MGHDRALRAAGDNKFLKLAGTAAAPWFTRQHAATGRCDS